MHPSTRDVFRSSAVCTGWGPWSLTLTSSLTIWQPLYLTDDIPAPALSPTHTHTHTHTHTRFVHGQTEFHLGQSSAPCTFSIFKGYLSFPGGSAGKQSACNAGDLGSIPGLGRFPGEGKGYPLQYSGLEYYMDCIVDGVAKSRTELSHFDSLTKGNLP